jgi:TadE-like protein
MKTSIRSKRQAGMTIVEFTLVIPFALLIVLGIIQAGLMFSARQLLNQAAFMAARAGSMQNAAVGTMKEALVTGLIPFYQDTTDRNNFSRLARARQRAEQDASCAGPTCLVQIEVLNPTPASFSDFGVRNGAFGNRSFIPNDNLEHRSLNVGGASGQTLHDANALKIKVTYGYELKVPLIKSVISSAMCAIDSGVAAFDRERTRPALASGNDCATFYGRGRIPIVSYATVQMQTPAVQ